MRILTILGSPRKNGNTAKVLGWIEEELRALGIEVDHIHITDFEVHGCTECYACRKTDIELCAQKDDGNELFRKMIAADAVLLASPLFTWSFSAQIKTLVDRMYCLVTPSEGKGRLSRIAAKPLGLLVTAAGGEKGNTDILVGAFENLVDYTRAKDAGHLIVPLCTTPDALGRDVRERAAAFARTLATA